MADLDFATLPTATMAPQTATDQVFEAIYDAVISLKLPPGTKVSEAEVAKQMDVSRQPVRDAFFRLSKLGFLLIRPQRATLITKISEPAVLEAVFVRSALEVACVLKAVDRITPEAITKLRQCISMQAAADQAQDPIAFHAGDEAFHRTICEISGHPHVWELIREQKAHMDRVRFLTLSEKRRQAVCAEHEVIVEALEAQDREAAEKLLRDHLGDLPNVLDAIRSAHAIYFEGTSV